MQEVTQLRNYTTLWSTRSDARQTKVTAPGILLRTACRLTAEFEGALTISNHSKLDSLCVSSHNTISFSWSVTAGSGFMRKCRFKSNKIRLWRKNFQQTKELSENGPETQRKCSAQLQIRSFWSVMSVIVKSPYSRNRKLTYSRGVQLWWTLIQTQPQQVIRLHSRMRDRTLLLQAYVSGGGPGDVPSNRGQQVHPPAAWGKKEAPSPCAGVPARQKHQNNKFTRA